ncbi:hypothetical protein [Candidatus Uabimicrobium amorphum]|uniref:Lipoprotein n=1 Tax=Uabimicrobium amorphum TaxID=2596890 RepID=A0A5S9IJQ4_UABAM|nr:hypothetical protein [Candidatus Uabimicrobium amorphum]BBM82726.1 hypothetical protein UABAM_01069 [Candidatus Uabimicrobium amorphum]
MRKYFVRIMLLLSLLSSGCVTTSLLSVTDPQPETFREYTSAWVGAEELIITYETDRGERWAVIDLVQGQHTDTLKGSLPVEEQQAKRRIPIIVRERQDDFAYHRSRFQRSAQQVNQLGKIFLWGDSRRYRDPQYDIQLIIEPIGNTYDSMGKSIPAPPMPHYRPSWAYPARIVGLPFAVCLDIAILPLWFVSYFRVSVRF